MFLFSHQSRYLLHNEICLALWPSPAEIDAREENNSLYLGGLTSFYHSLDALEMELLPTMAFKGWATHAYHDERGKPLVARAEPPIIAEFLSGR